VISTNFAIFSTHLPLSSSPSLSETENRGEGASGLAVAQISNYCKKSPKKDISIETVCFPNILTSGIMISTLLIVRRIKFCISILHHSREASLLIIVEELEETRYMIPPIIKTWICNTNRPGFISK
jgi:hypothetical protein